MTRKPNVRLLIDFIMYVLINSVRHLFVCSYMTYIFPILLIYLDKKAMALKYLLKQKTAHMIILKTCVLYIYLFGRGFNNLSHSLTYPET